ncbi:MAG: AsmA family protein [Candidatus Aminicenantes bacterium]|nr:AsmA family protein [Candidatus Aminicenantes bacterium]
MANRKRKVLRIAGGVILGVIVLIICVLLFGTKVLKSRIEATASTALGMDVRIRGGVNVFFSPGFGASLADITVKNGGADVATGASMKIGLKLLPLIWGRIRISRLELVKPVISIVRQKNGKLNIEMQRIMPLGELLTLKNIAVSQGSFLFTNLQSGGRIELEGVDITVGNISAGGTPGGDPLKTLSFIDDIRCRKIRAGTLTLTDLEMKLAGGKGVCDVSQARMKIFGGTGSGTLHADFTGTEPHFRIIFAVSKLKIEELLQESTAPKNMEGLAELSADLTARGKTAIEVKRSLSGQVSLDGENIALNSMDIDELISSLLRSRRFSLVDVGAFFLAGPFGPALTRGYRFADLFKESRGGNGVIAKLVSVWKIENGVAEAVDVAMATKVRRIAMKGGLNFIDNRFEDAVVAVLDQHGCAVVTQKVRGPFSRPEIGNINILKSLTSPVTNLLRSVVKLFGSRPCDVFYSGSVAPPAPHKLP